VAESIREQKPRPIRRPSEQADLDQGRRTISASDFEHAAAVRVHRQKVWCVETTATRQPTLEGNLGAIGRVKARAALVRVENSTTRTIGIDREEVVLNVTPRGDAIARFSNEFAVLTGKSCLSGRSNQNRCAKHGENKAKKSTHSDPLPRTKRAYTR
jgi:hypothetical protein